MINRQQSDFNVATLLFILSHNFIYARTYKIEKSIPTKKSEKLN